MKSRNVNQERRSIVLDYIKENYSLSSLLIDLGVWDGGNRVIKCPFHPDSRPSFNINPDNNYFKCFSCGLSGGYMTFYDTYKQKVEEDGKFFNEHVEELLANDLEMKDATKVGTIYHSVEKELSLEELAQYTKPQVVLERVDTRNLESIRRMLERKGDVDRLLDFFADVERGFTVEVLWNKYVNGIDLRDELIDPEEKSEAELSILNLLMDDDEDNDGEDDKGITNLFDNDETVGDYDSDDGDESIVNLLNNYNDVDNN